MDRRIGEYTASVNRDDRGRIVAEVWHNESGKTVGITEVDTIEGGWWWAKKLADSMRPELECTESVHGR